MSFCARCYMYMYAFCCVCVAFIIPKRNHTRISTQSTSIAKEVLSSIRTIRSFANEEYADSRFFGKVCRAKKSIMEALLY